jgi:hypothetical protein
VWPVAPLRGGIPCCACKLDQLPPLDLCGHAVKIHTRGGEAELRQLTLFGTEPRPLPREDSGGDRDRESADRLAGFSEANSGQIDLFTERARLARDLEGALRGGDFPQADRLRRLFEENFGVSAETRALGFLERLADPLASALPEEALPAWYGLDSGLETHPRLRRLLREGVLGRLLCSHSAANLASVSPGSLPALAWVLAARPEASAEDGKREARCLVRRARVGGTSGSGVLVLPPGCRGSGLPGGTATRGATQDEDSSCRLSRPLHAAHSDQGLKVGHCTRCCFPP